MLLANKESLLAGICGVVSAEKVVNPFYLAYTEVNAKEYYCLCL